MFHRCKKAAGALAKKGSLTSAAVEAVEMDMEEDDAVMEATQHEDNFDHASVYSCMHDQSCPPKAHAESIPCYLRRNLIVLCNSTEVIAVSLE